MHASAGCGVEDGGINGYSCTEYLNIWVGNITNGSSSQLLGYATFPGGLCEYDGVVIYYKVLGTLNSISPFNKGRTLTHEVGHYLNLIHIGGDRINGCGDDLCMDTPPQKGGNDGGEFGQNFGSPRHPHKAINECQGTNEEMFMNYMDYVNDSAMVFFTNDQKKRIRSLFIEGGDRSYFIYNNSENKAGFITERNRSDAYTPAITDFKKYFHCKPITDTCKYAFVFWTKIEEAKEYKVFAKKIKSDNWEVINTSNTYIKIGGLNSHILYEIKVQAILSNKLSSSESIPYVFSLKGSSFLKLKKLVLIE